MDLDATDDPLYGKQEGRFFHGYYGCYCYLPLYIFCGKQLLCAKLRPSGIDASKESKEEVEMIVRRLTSSKKLWIKSMIEDELKLFPEKFDKPLKNATYIGISFIAGAFVPIFPFIFLTSWNALICSIVVSIMVLFVVGIAKAKITNKSWLKSGFELTIFAMCASVICYFIGKLFSYYLM